jgi:hypothetical protein
VVHSPGPGEVRDVVAAEAAATAVAAEAAVRLQDLNREEKHKASENRLDDQEALEAKPA